MQSISFDDLVDAEPPSFYLLLLSSSFQFYKQMLNFKEKQEINSYLINNLINTERTKYVK